jgi:hypothetical protein
LCLSNYVGVQLCLSNYVGVQLCLSNYVGVQLCLSNYVGVQLCLSNYVDAQLCVSRHVIIILYIIIIIIIFSGSAAQRRLWPPRHTRFLYHTQRRAKVARTPLGRVISSSQRPLPDKTQHTQQTNIHAPGGIRTHYRSRRATVNLRLRSRGHWDRRLGSSL